MYEITSIEDWENTSQISDFLLLITKDSCEDCIDVERYLEKSSYLINKAVSYTHLRAHETTLHLVCRLLLEKKK